MDRFNSAVKYSIYDIKRVPALPKSNKGEYISISCSSDMFDKLLPTLWNLKTNLPVRCTIYDEREKTNDPEVSTIRIRILELLNRLNIENIDFKLSDDSLKEYNELMNIVNWKHQNNTTLEITINRHPFNNGSINLELSKGKLLLPDEFYLWLSDYSISRLNSKLGFNKVDDILRLKRVVENYYSKINKEFYLDLLTDLDKLYLAYNYMKSRKGLNISFAHNQTIRDIEGVQRLNRSETNWESTAIGTFDHKMGVCEGQARLLKALITNPYMKVDSEVINGKIPSGESHTWLGVVTNRELIQVCLTMRGMFSNLDKSGYIPYEDDVYSRIYTHRELDNNDEKTLRMHIRSLQR